MERTTSENGIVYLGETEFRMLMVRLILSHKFHRGGEMPSKIVLPAVSEVEGVAIEYAVGVVDALADSSQPTTLPLVVSKKEVKHAVTSRKTNSG